MQFLFGHDFQHRSGDLKSMEAELDEFCANFDAGKKALPYVRQLIRGICSHLDEINGLLTDHSHNWRLERMSWVDRNILRIAVFEMRYCDNVPARIAINEALEIAKRYSIADSVPFINGILDAVRKNS